MGLMNDRFGKITFGGPVSGYWFSISKYVAFAVVSESDQFVNGILGSKLGARLLKVKYLSRNGFLRDSW